MRPERLVLEGFGPFRARTHLDFRGLGRSSLFLVHGPTGAGKTTILDAMCFALYGEASGGERRGDEMRSQLAGPRVETEVTFDFQLGERRFRVTRKPRYERAKLRGQGVTVEEARATLWDRSAATDDRDEGIPLATKPSDVTRAVEERLGFSAAEFRQVIVLPQGDFRKLLTSSSEDREQILETLFRTAHYRAIEAALARATNAAKQEARLLDERLRTVLQEAGAESRAELESRRAADVARAAALRSALARAVEEERRARESLERARVVASHFEEREKASQALADLDAEEFVGRAKQVELDAAERAAPLVELERTLDRLRSEVATVSERLAAARRVADDSNARVLEAERRWQGELERQGERDAARSALDALSQIAERVTRWDAARAEHERAREAWERAQLALEQAKAGAARIEASLTEARASYDAARDRALRIEALQGAEVALAAERDRRLELAQVRSARDQARTVAEAARAAQGSNEAALDRSRARRDALESTAARERAAVLAVSLAPGDPCPVCGSLEHPSPARASGALPSDSDLETARAEVERLEAETRRDRAETARRDQELAAIEGRLASLEDGARSSLADTDEELEARHAATASEREAAETAAASAAGHASRAQALEHERGEAARISADAEHYAHELAAERAAVARLLEERAREVPAELRAPGALAAASDSARERLARLEGALAAADREAREAREAAARAEQGRALADMAASDRSAECERVKVELGSKLEARGFADLAALAAAVRSPDQLAALAREIRERADAHAAARDRVLRAEAVTKDLVAPDLASLEGASETSRRTVQDGSNTLTTLETELKRADRALETLTDVESRLAKVGARYGVLGRLSEVAGGRGNTLKMSFQRFVLAALLDEALVAASARLRTMSRGRFLLQRAARAGDRRVAGGLDLEVFDHHSGTSRAARTLSGGESFLASMALALGLADVVQAHTGGVRLETLFVDEGFGSLDAESLDLALRALEELERGGRLVGIVSHVSELAERIDARLVVTPTHDGSTARFVLP